MTSSGFLGISETSRGVQSGDPPTPSTTHSLLLPGNWLRSAGGGESRLRWNHGCSSADLEKGDDPGRPAAPPAPGMTEVLEYEGARQEVCVM